MEEVEPIVNEDLVCAICGEKTFTAREGFYYCQECGTKHEQVRSVLFDTAETFKDVKNIKKQKIHTVKQDKIELTSWECYNYVLRGLVEELITLGANEKFKPMVLQVWAAYLRKMEIAFFNKKKAELPKLGLRFLARDARTIYNHHKQRSKKRRRRSKSMSLASSEMSSRDFTMARKSLDQSEYSAQSSQDISLSSTSQSSAPTTRAIQLNYSSRARKYLKKIVPVKHLAKHELDVNGELKCHNLRPKARALNRMEHAITTLNIKQIYSILGIALNLTEDEIQLSDLVRFIDEDHIGLKYVMQYFPDNVKAEGKRLIREVQLLTFNDKYTDKVLRDHIGNFAKFINIRKFIKPDMHKLILRYITELNLPEDLFVYLRRLVNILPPDMATRAPHQYAQYEARAMAYIIFALKLLYGLDGHKEKLISESAQEINKKIDELSRSGETKHVHLFVWTEWAEFIEMRKVIISQYSPSFCRRFKQSQSISQRLEQLRLGQREQEEQDALLENVPKKERKVMNMRDIFERFLHNFSEHSQAIETIKFEPSLTPADSYLRRIKAQHSKADREHVVSIPEFMHKNHSESTLGPYVQAKTLKSFFKAHQCRVEVVPVNCTLQRCYVGVFHTPKEPRQIVLNNIVKADYGISEEAWLLGLQEKISLDELKFKTELERYFEGYLKSKEAKTAKRIKHEKEMQKLLKRHNNTPPKNQWKTPASSPRIAAEDADGEHFDIRSLNSIDVFQEDDMNPITDEILLQAPQRHPQPVNIFADLSDDEDDSKLGVDVINAKEIFTDNNGSSEVVTLIRSSMDYWMIAGVIYALTEVQKKCLSSKFPRSFFWLLETCAQTIGADWITVYEQLLAIECMFVYGIEDLSEYNECIKFKYNIPIKDINTFVNSFREIW